MTFGILEDKFMGRKRTLKKHVDNLCVCAVGLDIIIF